MRKKKIDLENEVRYLRKRLSDRTREFLDLREKLCEVDKGSAELNKAMDAILAQTAFRYGERVKDEETGEELGWRLPLPMFSVAETLEQYEVRTRRDETTQEYIVGVMERGQKNNEGVGDHGGT